MNLEKIKQSLSELFAVADREQLENRKKLDAIIQKLSEKKARVKEKMQQEGEDNETSEAYAELESEYQVISKLLKKAKQNYNQDNHSAKNEDIDG